MARPGGAAREETEWEDKKAEKDRIKKDAHKVKKDKAMGKAKREREKDVFAEEYDFDENYDDEEDDYNDDGVISVKLIDNDATGSAANQNITSSTTSDIYFKFTNPEDFSSVTLKLAMPTFSSATSFLL